jgi:general secretion pathway protein E
MTVAVARSPGAPTPAPPHGASTPADPPDPWAELAGLLLARGVLDAKMLERARRVAGESGQRLDAVLTQLGLITERGLAEALAALLALPLAGPERFPAEPLLVERLRPKFLRKAHLVPLALADDTLVVAMTDPLDAFACQAVAAATGRRVAAEVAVPIELEAALDRLYPEARDDAEPADAAEGGAGAAEEDAERLKDLASEAPVIRLVNQMIARAVETQASDIHIEPFEDRLRVRYRYDGVLHEAESPSAALTAAITSRIKIMARLDIAERRLPQDGRIKLAVRGQDIDFRVSTVPSLYGETVVLRVLDRTAVAFDYDRIGLPAVLTETLQGLLELPNGMVLVTGPTGSGKTTTLYTGLKHLNSVARKIVTVEDPVEYQLAGINQIQVKPQIGLSFAQLLRSILRQDPDVIMIGEIRDLETAQIAVQAALTGHLMLSTLHTNSAAATVTRLRDMGLEDYLITAVLKGVLAQRLVRRLCAACRRAVAAPAALIERFALDRRTAVRPIQVHQPVGCDKCRGTGYRGRQAIAELLIPTEAVQRLIFGRADHVAIEAAAVEAGMRTMFDAGIAAALDGVTTIEEVVRSIRADG